MTRVESTETEARTLAFFEQWGVSFDAMVASFHDSFAADCVWEQRPLAVTRGPDEAVRFLRRARLGMGLDSVHVEIRNITSSPGVVFTERVDHLRRRGGGLIVTAPVTGILEWRDGRVVAWREYFDAASFVGRALPGLATGVFERIRRPRS